jgi:hypothetical protein
MKLQHAIAISSLSYLFLHEIQGTSYQIFSSLSQPYLTSNICTLTTSQLTNPNFCILVVNILSILHILLTLLFTKINCIMDAHNVADVPLNAEPISTVFPDETLTITPPKSKSKKKKSKKSSKSEKGSESTVKTKKKEQKLKRGELKVPVTMEDLYLKDDPFNLKAKTSVEASGQGIKDKNVEASHAASAGSDSPVSEKGNVTKTQESDESAVKNLGLDALNAAIGTMNGDTAVSDGDKGGDTAHQTLEIPESEQNVEPDVETSLANKIIRV